MLPTITKLRLTGVALCHAAKAALGDHVTWYGRSHCVLLRHRSEGVRPGSSPSSKPNLEFAGKSSGPVVLRRSVARNLNSTRARRGFLSYPCRFFERRYFYRSELA